MKNAMTSPISENIPTTIPSTNPTSACDVSNSAEYLNPKKPTRQPMMPPPRIRTVRMAMRFTTNTSLSRMSNPQGVSADCTSPWQQSSSRTIEIFLINAHRPTARLRRLLLSEAGRHHNLHSRREKSAAISTAQRAHAVPALPGPIEARMTAPEGEPFSDSLRSYPRFPTLGVYTNQVI